MNCIRSVNLWKGQPALSRPYPISFDTITSLDSLLIEITDDKKRWGIGEATFLTGYSGENIKQGQVVARNIASKILGRSNAEAQNIIDLTVQDLRRQSIVGYADSQHTAKLIQGLKDGDLVTPEPQVVGHGQTGRAGADHGDFFRAFLNLRLGYLAEIHLVGGKSLQFPDGKRFIHFHSPAFGLAWMRTYTPVAK